jgi:hypothetical protein
MHFHLPKPLHGSSVRLRQAADSAKIHYDPKLVRDYAGQPNSKFSICTAMSDTPPKNYGSAPLDDVFDRLRNIPIIMAQ